MPGFPQKGFVYSAFGDALNIIWGPNGAGKTTSCLAIRKLLWPNHPSVAHLVPVALHGNWEFEGRQEQVMVEGNLYLSKLEEIGRHRDPTCYTIGLDELFHAVDQELARGILREILGGYDLASLRERPFYQSCGPRYGRHEEGQVRDRQRDVQVVVRKLNALQTQEDRLKEIEEQIKQAEIAPSKIALLDLAQKYQTLKQDYSKLQAHLKQYPDGLEKVHAEDGKVLQGLREKKRVLEEKVTRLEEMVLPESPPTPEQLELIRQKIDECRQLEKEIFLEQAAQEEIARQIDVQLQQIDLEFDQLDRLNFPLVASLIRQSQKRYLLDFDRQKLAEKVNQAGSSYQVKEWVFLGSLGLQAVVAWKVGSLLGCLVALVVAMCGGWLFWRRPRDQEQRKLLQIQEEQCAQLEKEIFEMVPSMQIPEAPLLPSWLALCQRALELKGELEKKGVHVQELCRQRRVLLVEMNRSLSTVDLTLEEIRSLFLSVQSQAVAYVRAVQSKRELQEHVKELKKIEHQELEILSRCQCTSLQEVFAKVELVSAYQSDRQKEREIAWQLESGGLLHLECGDLSPLLLETERLHWQKIADSIQTLSVEKGRIKGEIHRARHGVDLQKALGELQEAQLAWKHCAEEVRHRALAQCFLRNIEEEFIREYKPAVLEAGNRLMQTFTNGAYSVKTVEERRGFIAYDCLAEQEKPLEALSRGTRMQLILAMRLGFITATEKGAHPLPIVLDEAFQHADDERFALMAEALLKIASEGRQIFYFTCQRNSIETWKQLGAEFHFFDLQEIQTGQKVLSTSIKTLEPHLPVAEPNEGESLEEYAARTGAYLLDSTLPAGEQHISHFLDTSLQLHQLLLRRIATYGQAKSLIVEELLMEIDGDRHICQQVMQRGSILERGWELAKVGCPPSIGRHDLEQAVEEEILSTHFLEPMWEYVKSVDGRAQLLVEAIANKKIKNFRKEKLGIFTEFLEKRGLIDPRTPYSREQLRALLWSKHAKEGILSDVAAAYFIEKVIAGFDCG